MVVNYDYIIVGLTPITSMLLIEENSSLLYAIPLDLRDYDFYLTATSAIGNWIFLAQIPAIYCTQELLDGFV